MLLYGGVFFFKNSILNGNSIFYPQKLNVSIFLPPVFEGKKLFLEKPLTLCTEYNFLTLYNHGDTDYLLAVFNDQLIFRHFKYL